MRRWVKAGEGQNMSSWQCSNSKPSPGVPEHLLCWSEMGERNTTRSTWHHPGSQTHGYRCMRCNSWSFSLIWLLIFLALLLVKEISQPLKERMNFDSTLCMNSYRCVDSLSTLVDYSRCWGQRRRPSILAQQFWCLQTVRDCLKPEGNQSPSPMVPVTSTLWDTTSV